MDYPYKSIYLLLVSSLDNKILVVQIDLYHIIIESKKKNIFKQCDNRKN